MVVISTGGTMVGPRRRVRTQQYHYVLWGKPWFDMGRGVGTQLYLNSNIVTIIVLPCVQPLTLIGGQKKYSNLTILTYLYNI